MSDTCKCGHAATSHPDFVCSYLECRCPGLNTTPAPAPPADDGWLDAPDGDGWWWFRDMAGDIAPVNVLGQRAWDAFGNEKWQAVDTGYFDLGKWQRAGVPAPPAPPLPASRLVTLTARVVRTGATEGLCMWRGLVVSDTEGISATTFYDATAAKVVASIRERYGIEPVIEQEQAP